MIFPEFGNMKYIDGLREKYDPLVNKVRPHITLVFPFESGFSAYEISEILNSRLNKITPFEIKLQGLSASGKWLFLNLTDGIDVLTKIHNILYTNEFAGYKPDWLNKNKPAYPVD